MAETRLRAFVHSPAVRLARKPRPPGDFSTALTY
jgi:hypothetical protein